MQPSTLALKAQRNDYYISLFFIKVPFIPQNSWLSLLYIIYSSQTSRLNFTDIYLFFFVLSSHVNWNFLKNQKLKFSVYLPMFWLNLLQTDFKHQSITSSHKINTTYPQNKIQLWQYVQQQSFRESLTLIIYLNRNKNHHSVTAILTEIQ